MKKIWPILFSLIIALLITFYIKNGQPFYTNNQPSLWKTFEKTSHNQINIHKTTLKELAAANIPNLETNSKNTMSRNIAQEKSSFKDNYSYRDGRILIGDLHQNNYSDHQVHLEMVNKVNPNWKDLLGNDLIRFQKEDTKVMIKQEFPVIKIQNGTGQFLEQVIITYLLKNKETNSYRALIDSETGLVLETWDRTIHEKMKIKMKF